MGVIRFYIGAERGGFSIWLYNSGEWNKSHHLQMTEVWLGGHFNWQHNNMILTHPAIPSAPTGRLSGRYMLRDKCFVHQINGPDAPQRASYGYSHQKMRNVLLGDEQSG